jgi:hypothetical protein
MGVTICECYKVLFKVGLSLDNHLLGDKGADGKIILSRLLVREPDCGY